jgi:hypothetical protein
MKVVEANLTLRGIMKVTEDSLTPIRSDDGYRGHYYTQEKIRVM